MTVRQFRWVLVVLLGCVLTLSIGSRTPLTIGAYAEWAHGRHHFSGGTGPSALGVSALIVVAFVLLMVAKPVAAKRPLPGVLRRFAAFWLDFLLAIFALAPIIGAVAALVAWASAGHFVWTFERTTQAATDAPLMVLSFALLIPGLLSYYTIPLALRRPSPGACIAGYQVVADKDKSLPLSRALLRSIVGYFAICSAFIAPFVGRDKMADKFWLDKAFDTRAVLLS